MLQPTSSSTNAAGSIYRAVSSSSCATCSTDFSTACRCLLDGEPFTDSRDALAKILLSLRPTDKPGIYSTPDAMNEGRIILNLSVAGEAIVTVFIPGEVLMSVILTPVSQLWEDICNAPALAARIKLWRDWAGEYAPGENRAEALRRVTKCMLSGCRKLTLSNLELTRLPDALPAGLMFLDTGDNHLTRLPDGLPGSLEYLDVGHNNLTCLPDTLPAGLMFLDAGDNHLTRLPDGLPGSLEYLDVGHNKLTRLPGTLPARLTFLYAGNNNLESLPGDLPDGLTTLDVSHNNLMILPALPAGLKHLYVGDNPKLCLPDNWSVRLEILVLRGG